MAQVIQHKRGGLDNIKNIDPVYRGEFVLATGSLSIHNSSGSNGTQDVEVAFIGGVADYEPVTNFLSGGGLPSITTGTHGTYLDGIVWYDSSSGQQYQLNATVTATQAGAAAYTGSHIALTSPVSANGQVAIGAAEDGTYADGLFTDFTETTEVGTAVDRFNEILKALSPAPAPDLDDIDSNDTGQSAELSFGSSFSIPGYVSASGIGGFSAVDQDGTFSVTSAGNDLRRGVFNGSTTIDGDLNEDVAQDGINYPANAFGEGNLGTLFLEVNGSNIHSTDLTTFTSGDDLNANGSGFNLSITSSAQFPDTTELDTFQHRTGTWKVHPNDQNEYGWNYARVKHTVGSSTKTTNYVTWVNDPSASNAANDVFISTEQSTGPTLTGTNYISGVKYFTTGSGTYTASIDNAYINVYSSAADAISYNETRIDPISSEAIPALSGANPTSSITVQKNYTLPSNTRILNQDCTISTTVKKPFRSDVTSNGITFNNFLYNNESNTSTLTSETFRKENYRVKAAAYATQGSVPTTSGDTGYWEDGSFNLGNVDLSTEEGLLVYNRRLCSPTNATYSLNGGDFDGAVFLGPAFNADYSAIASSTSLTFYRIFRNTSGGSVFQFDLNIQGTGTLVSSPTTGNQFKMEFRLPTNSGTGFGTAWLDGTDTTYVVGAVDTSLDLTNTYTTLTQGISNNDYIVVRVTARGDWSGFIDAMSVTF